MESVKFTPVKLIIHYFVLISFVHLLAISEGMAQQKFVVQIAASKTPFDIQEFAEKYKVTDSISVVKSELWYRYYVGSFDNKNLASKYAKELVDKTKLSNAIVKVLDDFPRVYSPIIQKDSVSILKHAEDSTGKINIEKQNLNSAKSSSDVPNLKPENLPNQESENFFLRLFLKDSEIATLKNKLIIYGNNHVPGSFRGAYMELLEKSFQYAAILIFTALIVFFLLNIIIVLLILNYTIRKKNQENKFLRIFGKMYEEVLMAYMFGEIEWEKTCFKLKRKEKKENRKVLISILLNFKENFKGDLEKFIPEIFVKLNLHKDSLKSARSSNTYRKVQGLMELIHLFPEGAKEIIPDLINDPNDFVRAEAQTAYIRLNPDEPFKFFETLNKPFTRWTQLTSFYLIRLHQIPVPSFANYLDSKHVNIRNFSLRMIIFFQQLENVSRIIEMLDSEIEQTRYLSYRAINDLRIYEGKETIKNKFLIETGRNKLEIIKAFKNIGDEEDFEFLEKIMETENVSLKTEACRSIYFMSSKGEERLLNLKNDSISELDLLIAHVTDSRN